LGGHMRLTEILTADRIVVDPSGDLVGKKSEVLAVLARLLSTGSGADPAMIEHQLAEREKLQSTGIGDGVAIPHTSIEEFSTQKAALILAPRGIEFESIDGNPASIIFGVVGPKRAASEHLKILAKVSRLLRSPETRRRLLEAAGPEQAYTLIEEHEASSMNP
jgi:PTS system nitrogen regulatory IIA component